jgi:hypothetical protein
MAYFNRFPLTAYLANNRIDFSIVTDITKRVAVRNEIKENYTVYDEYDVLDGETPEVVAYRLYDTTEYHWIILLLNDMIDPRYDWPLTVQSVRKFTESKYGADDANVYGTHHYQASTTNTIIVDSDDVNFPDKITVSNIEFELTENEKKRRIKVLKKEFVPAFITEFEKLINA